ncbi:nucleoside triphosphate pyrophosphohydrolase family protein [Chromobacterium sp. IIBBL 290-4]|uniref:nucleoside triphosphate pyrophosphohydrolase family protein n=1 Tax=Chromobacterium sp. IIBBL 290-4 TaxID=2953890 RepID=UPI0020B6B617|nr:nucleoside triphosphate pyrophosphohydrolase family protein [Chromobacterium sp. IIBBL 290-4]UTH74286.1 nucleoside triphosphate pyrophosphohydrolase family protein [Chromobacterium sp. IIBBL 290-4]
MSNLFEMRRDFMRRFDIPSPAHPEFQPEQLAMWQTMLDEELAELRQALADYRQLPGQSPEQQLQSRAELTAEAVDVLNVVCGLLLSQGLPLETMCQAIHDANLRKCVDGKVVRREDGKVLKPEGWLPADKTGVILAAQTMAKKR